MRRRDSPSPSKGRKLKKKDSSSSLSHRRSHSKESIKSSQTVAQRRERVRPRTAASGDSAASVRSSRPRSRRSTGLRVRNPALVEIGKHAERMRKARAKSLGRQNQGGMRSKSLSSIALAEHEKMKKPSPSTARRRGRPLTSSKSMGSLCAHKAKTPSRAKSAKPSSGKLNLSWASTSSSKRTTNTTAQTKMKKKTTKTREQQTTTAVAEATTTTTTTTTGEIETGSETGGTIAIIKKKKMKKKPQLTTYARTESGVKRQAARLYESLTAPRDEPDEESIFLVSNDLKKTQRVRAGGKSGAAAKPRKLKRERETPPVVMRVAVPELVGRRGELSEPSSPDIPAIDLLRIAHDDDTKARTPRGPIVSHTGNMNARREAHEQSQVDMLLAEASDWVFDTLQKTRAKQPLVAWADGVDLCNIIQHCHSKLAIKRKMHKGATPFSVQARENLVLFTQACRDVGVPPVCIFEPDDLLHLRNPKHVAICILGLAHINASTVEPPAIVRYEIDILQLEHKDAETNDSQKKDENPVQRVSKRKHRYVARRDDPTDEALAQVLNLSPVPPETLRIRRVRNTRGEYRFGGKPSIMYVRLVRGLLLVRVGGGWESLLSFFARQS